MNRTHFFYTAVVFSIAVVLSACAAAENSASQAFDNANSVVKHGGDKLFIEPEATPIPNQNPNRY